MNGHKNEHPTLSKRHLYRADFTHALRVQSHRTDTETTLRAEFGVCGSFPDGQASSARPHVSGHTNEHPALSKRHLHRADFTHALRVQSHRTDTVTTLRAKFFVCGYFPDDQSSSVTLHVNGNANEHPTLSKGELHTADHFQALREQAHITDTETTLRAEFVVCGHFPDGQASSTKPHVNGHPNEHTTLS